MKELAVKEQLVKDLKRDEGVKLFPYHCTGGKLTIGIGRNLEDRGITVEEAEVLLGNDIDICIGDLVENLPWFTKLSNGRRRALVNMRFNLGMAGLLKFKKMLTALELGAYYAAAAEALDSKWASQVGERAQRIAELIRKG